MIVQDNYPPGVPINGKRKNRNVFPSAHSCHDDGPCTYVLTALPALPSRDRRKEVRFDCFWWIVGQQFTLLNGRIFLYKLIIIVHMKSVASGVFSLMFMLSVVSVAEAQIDLDLPGLDIEIDGDDVSVDAGAVDVNVSDTGSSVQIDDSATQIDVSDRGVDITTQDTAVQVRNTGAVGVATDEVDIDVLGTGVLIVDDELSVQLEEGSVNVKTAEMLLEIDEEDSILIQTDSDVRAYAQITADSNPQVAGVSVGSDSVSVTYQEEGNLLGIFPVSYETSVVVRDSGEVSIESPWYSFMVFGTKSAAVKGAVATKIKAGGVEIESTPLRRARHVDVAADAVRTQLQISDDTVSVSTDKASVEVNDGAGIEVQGTDGEYIRISDDFVNISL